ncbi:hypothetical protein ACDI110481_18190 [Acinetobacter dispersus]
MPLSKPAPTPLPVPATPTPLLLLLVVSLSSITLLFVVDVLLIPLTLAPPIAAAELPIAWNGVVTGVVTLASSPLPLPIP